MKELSLNVLDITDLSVEELNELNEKIAKIKAGAKPLEDKKKKIEEKLKSEIGQNLGIETELFMDNIGGERILRLTGSLWNCADGSEVPFEVYAEKSDNFESISHYVQPDDSVKKVFDNARRAIAEAGEIAKEL
mgnify:CR=1 FL=1